MKYLNLIRCLLLPFHYIISTFSTHISFSLLKNKMHSFSFIFLLIMPITTFATTWIKSTDGLSASTNPSPYDNYTNITTTLSIPSATALNVSVTGRTENNYDFLYITDSSGNTQTFDNSINTTYTVTGSSITLRFTSDYSITTTGVTVNISDATPPPQLDTFAQRYTTNLKGNLKVIGNTVLQSSSPTSLLSNAQLRLSYVNIDSGSGRFNSSSATINPTEAGVDVTGAGIIWAGLYWQGYLHNDSSDSGIDNVYNFSTNQSTANTQISAAIQAQTILLKVNNLEVNNGAYIPIVPQEIGLDRNTNTNNYVSYTYAAFADVTAHLTNTSPSATYTVANIATRSGQTSTGNTYDGLGNFGAWSLVVIYDNNVSLSEKTRNLTVFDGYTVLSALGNPNETINLSGFKTPSIAPDGVDSTLSVFAGEGDRNILGDFASLTNQDGYTYNLPDNSGAGSYFASFIEGVPNRNPIILNNNGIDIHTTQVGTSGGATLPIKENQTNASVRLGTTGDTFMPSMIAFATELFTPKLCYDYDVRIDDHIKIPSDNREISTARWASSPLSLTLLIRSELSDFPLTDSKLNVTFSPSTLGYISGSSQVSPPNANSYSDIGEINSATGQIGIGTGATDSTGGTIGALESTYAKQKFSFLSNRFDGNFDIQVAGNIQFDPNSLPIPYVLSTGADENSPNYIGRCASNPIYNPIWANFNIERPDSDPSQSPQERYPLYTQIVGKDFNVSIRSYQRNLTTGEYDIPLDTNATVELEIIDASVFDNNASAGYDSTCEEPNAIGDGAFINFAPDGINRSRAEVRIPQDIPNFANDTALQNAAFRLWIITTTEINGTKNIITHNCTTASSDTCFRNLYQNDIVSYDTSGNCRSSCQTSYTAEGCYECLREYFASPICSRDNFSIRPESFRIGISDNNETNDTKGVLLTDNSSNLDPSLSLAAGYNYAIDINATRYNSDTNARAYYNEKFVAASGLGTLGDKTKSNTIAALEFVDNASCNDTTHRSYNLKMQDGKLYDNAYISHNNVGQYNMWMLDSNWTNVDQSTYPYKVNFGSCTIGSTDPLCTDCDIANPSSSERNSDGKLGCVINSNLSTGSASKDDDYREIPLRFEPYTFDVSGIIMGLPNNNNLVYMNDLNTTNILDRAMAVRFNGPLAARGKQGTQLSNYTETCAARTVLLDINRSVTQNGSVVNENSIMSIDPQGFSSGQIIRLQRYDNSLDANSTFSEENNETNSSLAINIQALQFKDEDNGSTTVRLEYNFNRIFVSNPLAVLFDTIDANSVLSSSSADMQTTYIPRGSRAVQSNVNFVYGRVAPHSNIPYTVPQGVYEATIPVYTEAFCSGLAIDNSMMDCSLYDLNLSSQRDSNIWWVTESHDSDQGDGRLESVKDQSGSTILSIDPDSNVDLNNPTNITVTIPTGAVRPYTTTIQLTPDVPWLDWAAGSTPIDPIVNFLGGGGWAGKGNTGMVVDTNASSDINNKRIGW